MEKIILASASPRRRELLAKMGVTFTVACADIDETLPDGTAPRDGVVILAVKKGDAVARNYPDTVAVLSSDTLVELDGKALGKPTDANDARAMLRALSGKVHTVRTGVALRFGGKVFADVDSTDVYFRELSDAEIDEYVKTGEPMDKAGAYGIQGKGGAFVSHIDGDFDTVMGLSCRLVKRFFEEAGLNL